MGFETFQHLPLLTQYYWVLKYGSLLACRQQAGHAFDLYLLTNQAGDFFVELESVVDGERRRNLNCRCFMDIKLLQASGWWVDLPEG